MNPIAAFQQPCVVQRSSPLFARFPGEIRATIYREALQSFEDKTRAYDLNTSYRRPDYLAPVKVDCALLQTCQSIYHEAWFYPWVSAVHTFWQAWEGRRPAGVEHKVDEFKTALQILHDQHGQVFLSHIRVFSQLCEMHQLGHILRMPYFYPRVMTITIRHHDWWNWESDQRLTIDPVPMDWDFPASLVEIRMELESLKRKQDQIDWVADRMVENWWFRRSDGVIMTAKAADYMVETWRGSSTWEGTRWTRDEVAPNMLEYYIKTVVWRSSSRHIEDLGQPQPIEVPDYFPVIGFEDFEEENDEEQEEGEEEEEEEVEDEDEEDSDEEDSQEQDEDDSDIARSAHSEGQDQTSTSGPGSAYCAML